MSSFREPSRPEDIPDPNPGDRLLSAFVEGWVSIHPKEQSLALLRATARVLADREATSSVVIRLKKADRDRQLAIAAADRQALAMFRQMLEGCVARLLPDEETGEE